MTSIPFVLSLPSARSVVDDVEERSDSFPGERSAGPSTITHQPISLVVSLVYDHTIDVLPSKPIPLSHEDEIFTVGRNYEARLNVACAGCTSEDNAQELYVWCAAFLTCPQCPPTSLQRSTALEELKNQKGEHGGQDPFSYFI
ncbi:hypothetical protein Y032_0130g1530 [Ancylostoma ceylanicum]|uniref:Uncharacterized protein n=1 Tax=Ancylostoma ceylanicum TaxID=53326 RepID=A0A016T7C2_9BILA|nr:hypothetical protein Y032_0130g1530 [Ancylostoma ceylanicum]